MPGSHAKLSPSASSTWMNCPGMPTMAAPYEKRSSPEADRGTRAHKVLELCLLLEQDAKDYIGEQFADLVTLPSPFNQEDADAVQQALDFIRGEIQPGDEWDSEVQLQYNDDFWGTCDFNRFRPETAELLVVDYKHGSGVPVDAQDNPQGVSYALMKVKSLGNRGISRVRFVIIQPRCFHDLGEIREFVIEGIEMLEWEDKLTAAIHEVAEAAKHRKMIALPIEQSTWPAVYLKRGKWCRWCPANFAGGCPLATKEVQEAAELDFSAAEKGYDPAELSRALAVCDRAAAAIEATRAFAYQEADNGVKIPGFKLVAKRPTERYTNADGAAGYADLLGLDTVEIYEPRQVKSPAQLRSAIAPLMDGTTKKAREEAAKVALSEFTEKVSSGTTLAPESDLRPVAKKRDATADFDPILE